MAVLNVSTSETASSARLRSAAADRRTVSAVILAACASASATVMRAHDNTDDSVGPTAKDTGSLALARRDSASFSAETRRSRSFRASSRSFARRSEAEARASAASRFALSSADADAAKASLAA